MALISVFQGSEWYSSKLSASDRLKLMYESQKKLDGSGFSGGEKDVLKSTKQGE